MQVDQHIRACPAIREANGLEPYPQPSVVFSATPTGTVQVRIYDVSVQPMVELTSSALFGAELTSPTLTGLSNNYVLDMGHANVTAVVNCMTREGLECVVMFEDSGGTGEKRYVRVTCNDADHVVALFPDQAIYAVDSSGNTGTAFPNGSIYKPCSLIADACSLLTSRGSTILDVSGGNFNGGTDVPTNAKCGTALQNKVIRCRPGYLASWLPNVDNIDVTDALFLGSKANFQVKHYSDGAGGIGGHVGPHQVIDCDVGPYRAGATSGRNGSPKFRDCNVGNDVGLLNLGGRTNWNMSFTRCVFEGGDTVTLENVDTYSSTPLTMTECTGEFTLTGLASKTANILGVIGSPDITLASGVTNSTINISGAFNSVTDNGTSNTVNQKQLAHRANLTANIVNLASGSITSTEAPNLDAAISSRSTFNAASDNVTVGTNNDKTGYSISGTIQSLDALDTAQDTQHAQTQSDIAALSIPTAAQNADAVWDEAYAAHTSAGTFGKLMDTLRKANFLIEGTVNGTPTVSAFDTTLTEVTGAHDSQIVLFTSGALLGESRPIDTYSNTNGRLVLQEALTAAPSASDEFVILPHHVHSISEIQNGLATSAALAVVDSNVDALLVRLGANDTAIIKGLLLGNYKLDGGSGNASAVYDSNGCMTAGRIRVFAGSSATSSATAGAADGADSEIARVDLTASAVAGEAYPATVQGLLT